MSHAYLSIARPSSTESHSDNQSPNSGAGRKRISMSVSWGGRTKFICRMPHELLCSAVFTPRGALSGDSRKRSRAKDDAHIHPVILINVLPNNTIKSHTIITMNATPNR